MAVRTLAKYQTDLQDRSLTTPLIGQIITSPNTELITIGTFSNLAPTADVTTSIPIRVSGTKKYGITARHLVISRIAGTGTDEYLVYRRVPILKPSVFDTILSSVGLAVTYEGFSDWQVVGGQNERYHLFLGN
jgi:hypothetical protein